MKIGEALRKARVEKGYSLEFLEEATKIRAKYLEALENEKFDVLPGQVYAKAFLRTYAKFLGLDMEEIIREFLDGQNESRSDEIHLEKDEQEAKFNGDGKKWKYLVAGLAVVTLLGVNAFYNTDRTEENKPDLPKSVQKPPATGKTAEPPKQAPEAGEQPAAQGVKVILKVSDNESWMQVVADGNTVFSGMVAPGEMKNFQAQEKIFLHVGNAGAVEVNVNGKDLGRLGEKGKVVKIPFFSGQEPKLNQG